MTEVKHKSQEIDQKEDKQNIKVLFLDVDGVLRECPIIIDDDDMAEQDEASGLQRDVSSGLYISQLQRIKHIIDATDCYIVLSSAWRLFEEQKKLLFDAMQLVKIDVQKRYIGDTPKHLASRAIEIKQWLFEATKHYNVLEWVAVDDAPLDLTDDHFVQTDGPIGLTDVDMNKLICILNHTLVDQEVVEQKEDKQSIKVLFLDVDGVLCDLSLTVESTDDEEERDKASGLYISHLQRLKRIIDDTDCYIVLSTSWRLFESSKKLLFDAMQHDQVKKRSSQLSKFVKCEPVN
eukprot:137601_1